MFKFPDSLGLGRRLGPYFDDDWIHRLGLPVGRRAEFDFDWISMENRLGRRLGPEFDYYCFPMDDSHGGPLTRTGPDFDEDWIPVDHRLGLRRRTGVFKGSIA